MRTPEPEAAIDAREAIPRAEALSIAQAVIAPIKPLLLKLEDGTPQGAFTGSLRRKCPLVNDIDVVLMPARGQREEIQRHLYYYAAKVLCRGEQKMSVLTSDGAGGYVQMDVWFARCRETDGEQDLFAHALPSNWGTLLLYSTGSAAHNVRIASAAQARGWHWHQFSGLDCGVDPAWPDAGPRIVSQTEEAIFTALDMPFVPAWERR